MYAHANEHQLDNDHILLFFVPASLPGEAGHLRIVTSNFSMPFDVRVSRLCPWVSALIGDGWTIEMVVGNFVGCVGYRFVRSHQDENSHLMMWAFIKNLIKEGGSYDRSHN